MLFPQVSSLAPPCPVELYILQRSVEMWLPVFTLPSPNPLLLTHPTAFAWLAQHLLSLLHLTIIRLYTCPSLIKRFLEGRAWSYSSLISQWHSTVHITVEWNYPKNGPLFREYKLKTKSQDSKGFSFGQWYSSRSYGSMTSHGQLQKMRFRKWGSHRVGVFFSFLF